jgi:hypothetical protein
MSSAPPTSALAPTLGLEARPLFRPPRQGGVVCPLSRRNKWWRRGGFGWQHRMRSLLIQHRPNSAIAERCRSGRTGRSRKPLSLLRGTEGSNPSLSASEFVATACLPARQRGAMPPSSGSQISDTTPEQVTCCSPAVAPAALTALTASRSYPTGGGSAPPGSVGQQWFRSLPTADGPPVPCGALKPAHAGAPAALPMWLPLGPSPLEPSLPPAPSAANPLQGTASRTLAEDWTTGRRGPARRGPADLGPARPDRDQCAAPRPVQQTRARQRSQRRPRDTS